MPALRRRPIGPILHRLGAVMGGLLGGVGSVAPAYASSEVGDVNETTIVVTFTQRIESPGANYAAGVTIKVNGAGATISSATRQAGELAVHYVISAAADANDVVTWEYDAGPGDIRAIATQQDMGTTTAQTTANRVGTHLWFDRASDSGHLVTAGV